MTHRDAHDHPQPRHQAASDALTAILWTAAVLTVLGWIFVIHS